jgi:cytochrome c553
VNTKTYIIGTALTLLLTAFSALAPAAEDDTAQGRILAYTCMGCHGIEGYRNAYPSYRVPRLGGQKSGYIKAALTAYRGGSRQHPTMQAQAGSLSDVDIGVLATYFVSPGAASDVRGLPGIRGRYPTGQCGGGR